ncbi:hypothetical protein WDU94_007448 [Cyamophila willieti]
MKEMLSTCVTLVLLLDLATVHCQLFTMDQSKILRIYGDILPKKNTPTPVDNKTVTEKLHVKHYSNSKINTYLNNIHKNELFDQNYIVSTPKTISEVNGLLNSKQNTDWAPTEPNFQPNNWGDANYEVGNQFNSQNNDWSASNGQNEEEYYSSTAGSANDRTPSDHQNHRKSTQKRQGSNHYDSEHDGSAAERKYSDWSTPVNNFVTPPQYSTIYKQHKTKSQDDKSGMKNVYDDWSTPRSMSAYSEWLTTPQPHTTPPSKQSNSWSPHQDSNWVTIKPTKPTAEHLSTSGPDLDEFISRQENRYKKHNSLYSGVNSYGTPSQDILSPTRDYRQTVNSYNPTILKDQFDIPANIHAFDPYSEYQDYSSSTSRYPSTTDHSLPSTTRVPSYADDSFQSNFRPAGPNFNNNFNHDANNRFVTNNFNTNQKNYGGFGEPEVVIENKYQTSLKKHFDNTINLYEGQSKHIPPKRNVGANSNINLELPNSNIKFEVSSTEQPPRIVIENYHLTTEHPQDGYSEVYNRKIVPTVSQNSQKPKFQRDNIPQYSQNNINLPGSYDYSPEGHYDVTPGLSFTSTSVPVVSIGGGFNQGASSSYFDGNVTPSPPSISYEIPHLKTTEHKKPHINWCRLKSKRFITDKRCVSFEPVVESVCSDNCVMPPKGHPPSLNKWRKGAPSQWTCVESHIQTKKVKLRCQDKSIRWYNLKVVNGCDCRKKPIKLHDESTDDNNMIEKKERNVFIINNAADDESTDDDMIEKKERNNVFIINNAADDESTDDEMIEKKERNVFIINNAADDESTDDD